MEEKVKIPLWQILTILIGFPMISFLVSSVLLQKDWFARMDLDFFTIFWMLVAFWYLIQIWIIIKVLKSSDLSLKEIGYTFNFRKTLWFIVGYLVFAFSLFTVVELALASANITADDMNSLSDLSNITPLTSRQRIIFILVGLIAGISEEFVYRGFAIQFLEKYGINKWITVVITAIPFVFQHGLKSIDQFWWFFIWGLVLGAIFILSKRKRHVTIIIHWIVILSAILAILQLIE